MTNPVDAILAQHSTLVIDGALATELERRGFDLKDDLWSAKILVEQPAAIQQLHYDYFQAGADCAITASYQATFEGFRKRGLSEHEGRMLIHKAVELARAARDEFWADPMNRVGRSKPFIAASVGPYGAFLADGSEYRGNYGLTEKELMDFHRPRLKALLEAGPDMLACETIPSLIEAQALAKLLEEFPGVSAWFSFSARDGQHISEGQLFADCVQWLDAYPQIVAVGINCTSPRYVPALVAEAKRMTTKPILAYPNSGEGYDASKGDWDGVPVYESFGEEARAWYEAGARLIGGCCRSTPEDIQVIAGWARSHNK